MRTGVNALILGENPTGLGVYCLNLTRQLDRERTDLIVYSSRREAFDSLRAAVRPAPVRTRPERGLRGHVMRLLWTQSTLRRLASMDNLEVILNPLPEGMLGRTIPQVTVVHDLIPLLYRSERRRHQEYYFRWFVRRLLHASDVIIADSEMTRCHVTRQYGVLPTRLVVIYPGYDPGVYYPDELGVARIRDETPYFLYVGNLIPHKNLLRLIDAFAIVRRRARCRLMIRGEARPDRVRPLRERVQALGLTGDVAFATYMTDAQLRRLYTGARCLVLPSLGEGFGLPAVEAMACGTPVVMTTRCGVREVAGDAALVVGPDDPAGLAEAMHRVLIDRYLREELRERGLRCVRPLTWRSTAEQVSRLLEPDLRAQGTRTSGAA